MSLLHTVTISGADDAVDPDILWELGRKYDFVEWGLLWSEKRQGSPRYPSVRWLKRARELDRISLHLCGEAARFTLAGRVDAVALGYFLDADRVQINARPEGLGLAAVLQAYDGTDCPLGFILQCESRADLHRAASLAEPYNVSALIDASGGTGRPLPDILPEPPTGLCVGYAGGIVPGNVASTIEKLEALGRPFWIDLESGARDENDRFDLERVEAVLARCAEFREGGAL